MYIYAQARPNHSEAARAIGEQLGIVVQELRDGESGSELNIAKAGFKKEVHFYTFFL